MHGAGSQPNPLREDADGELVFQLRHTLHDPDGAYSCPTIRFSHHDNSRLGIQNGTAIPPGPHFPAAYYSIARCRHRLNPPADAASAAVSRAYTPARAPSSGSPAAGLQPWQPVRLQSKWNA